MELYNKDAYINFVECIMVTLHSIVGTIYDCIYAVSCQDIEMTVFVLRRDEIYISYWNYRECTYVGRY